MIAALFYRDLASEPAALFAVTAVFAGVSLGLSFAAIAVRRIDFALFFAVLCVISCLVQWA